MLIFVKGNNVSNLGQFKKKLSYKFSKKNEAGHSGYFKWVLVILQLLSHIKTTENSHFRGGTISWIPLSPNTVKFDYRLSWRRSYSPFTFCNATTIENRNLIPGMGSLKCKSGCTGDISNLDIRCTDYSYLSDWISGTYSTVFSFPDKTRSFEAIYEECCWMAFKSGKEWWSLNVKGSLEPRFDNGKINTAPKSSTPPIIRFQIGCPETYKIPVFDSDGDYVRCRFAKNRAECGDVCGYLEEIGGTLDEENCTIHLNVDHTIFGAKKFEKNFMGQPNYKIPVTIILEDFSQKSRGSMSDNEMMKMVVSNRIYQTASERDNDGGRLGVWPLPFSSVSLQFLAEFIDSDMSCAKAPIFVNPTPRDGTCIPVPIGEVYRANIEIDSLTINQNIIELITTSPNGLTLYPIQKSDKTKWTTSFEWEPSAHERGANIFCFAALNSAGQRSQQRCIQLFGGTNCSDSQKDVQLLGDVSISCYKDGMDIVLREPSTFHGIIYAKELYTNPLCKKIVKESSIKPSTLFLSYDKCTYKVEQDLKSIYYMVVVQPHPKLLTLGAKSYKCVCQVQDYHAETHISSHVKVKMLSRENNVLKNSGPTPYLKMYIADENNDIIEKAVIGQRLHLRIDLEPHSRYGIWAKDCYALNDESKLNYHLIDKRGCSLDFELMESFRRDKASKSIYAAFSAFKFPISQSLIFHCDIRLCVHQCPEPKCLKAIYNSTKDIRSNRLHIVSLSKRVKRSGISLLDSSFVENMNTYPLIIVQPSEVADDTFYHKYENFQNGIYGGPGNLSREYLRSTIMSRQNCISGSLFITTTVLLLTSLFVVAWMIFLHFSTSSKQKLEDKIDLATDVDNVK